MSETMTLGRSFLPQRGREAEEAEIEMNGAESRVFNR